MKTTTKRQGNNYKEIRKQLERDRKQPQRQAKKDALQGVKDLIANDH